MDIEESIKVQNEAFASAVNRKLGNPLPESLIQKQLKAGQDPFAIGELAIKTKREIQAIVTGSKGANDKGRWNQFISWIMRRK